MRTSSAQPKRKAGSRPHPSRMKTYMPPVAGSSPESSASVSAPHSANSPPATHTDMSGSGPGSLSAMPAGERKIPEPIVEPTSTATALQRPSWRVRDGAGASAGAGILAGADIREGWAPDNCPASTRYDRRSKYFGGPYTRLDFRSGHSLTDAPVAP